MWVSKKKWEAITDRVDNLEAVLFHVERGSNLHVVNKGDMATGGWGTAGSPIAFLGFSRAGSSVDIATLFKILLQKIGLQTERSPEGNPIITEIPKATGGKSGRSK